MRSHGKKNFMDATALSAKRRRRSLLRWIVDAIMEARWRDTEREIRRLIGSSAGPLSDEMERRIDRHLMRNSSFLP
jgi:hypothetical protein